MCGPCHHQQEGPKAVDRNTRQQQWASRGGIREYDGRRIQTAVDPGGGSVNVIASSERLTERERKDLGAFYTPSVMTDFCARWAIRTCHDTILDPGCGDAAFLLSGATRLRNL